MVSLSLLRLNVWESKKRKIRNKMVSAPAFEVCFFSVVVTHDVRRVPENPKEKYTYVPVCITNSPNKKTILKPSDSMITKRTKGMAF